MDVRPGWRAMESRAEGQLVSRSPAGSASVGIVADVSASQVILFSGVPYDHLVGKQHDAARLGPGFAGELPADRVSEGVSPGDGVGAGANASRGGDSRVPAGVQSGTES